MRIKVDFNFILDDLYRVIQDVNRNNKGAIPTNLILSAIGEDGFYEFLKGVAKDTFYLSQQLVPVDTGKLKNSGDLKISPYDFTIEYNTSYAGYVHEIIDNNYKHGQSKFLQDAFAQVMLNLISTYGEQNIPDFDVSMVIGVEEGVKLIIMNNKGKKSSQGMSWRRFLGL